jgi:hypothetical protein
MRKRLMAVGIVALAVAAAGSISLAAIGDGGTVKTCYSKSTWRPIDSSASCKSGEQQLDLYSKAGADATFLGRTAKAADSETLDGIDSTGFVRGSGTQAAFKLTPTDNIRNTDAGQIAMSCAAPGSGLGAQITFFALNPSHSDVDLWTESDGSLSRATVPDRNIYYVQPWTAGLHRLIVRSMGAGVIGQWDLLVDGDGCETTGLEIIFPA